MRLRRIWGLYWVEIVIILAPLLLFSFTMLSGQSLFWGTPALQFIPWRAYAWEQIFNGESLLPLWNPLNGMGAPLLANYQLAWFYPPGWLLGIFFLLGGVPALAWAHTLLAALHLAWAGLGMVRLLRRVGVNDVGQAIAGLAFALSGTLVARVGFFSMIWTAAWLPWLIYAACDVAMPGGMERGGRWLSLRLALVSGLMLLAGHAQFAWYALLLATAWVGVGAWGRGGWRDLLASWLRFGAGIGMGVCLAAAQLLPTAEYLFVSQRAAAYNYERAMTYSFWPWRLLTLFAPDWFGNPGRGDYWGYASYWEDAIYIGLLPFMLGVSTLRAWGRNAAMRVIGEQVRIRFCWVLMMMALLLALGKHTPIFPFLFRYIPSFDMFQAPARYMLWFIFGLTLLAGMAAGNWERPVGRLRRRMRTGLVAALAVMLGAGAAWLLLPNIEATFLYASALAGFWAVGAFGLGLRKPFDEGASANQYWKMGVVGWLVIDLLIAGWWLNPGTGGRLYVDEAVLDDVPQFSGRMYLSAKDEDVLKFGNFLRFTDFRFDEDPVAMRKVLLPNLNLLEERASVNNFDPLLPGRYVKWMEALELRNDEDRLRWLELMNVNWWQRVGPDGVVRVDWVEGASRFHWYGCAEWVGDEEAAWQALETQIQYAQDERCVVLEQNEDLPVAISAGNQKQFEVMEWSEKNGWVEILTVSSSDGWFVLSDLWYPYWYVFVDDQEETLWQGNYLFRAVFLPEGTHRIVFEYRPLWLMVGLVLSVLAVIGFVVMWRFRN